MCVCVYVYTFVGTSKRGLFGDAAQELDWLAGQVMSSVESAGVAENTITFFTSDNGPWTVEHLNGGSAGPFRDGKGSVWEGIRIFRVCMHVYTFILYLCIYIYICVYICLFTYVCIYVCIYVSVSAHVYLYLYIYVCMYVCMCGKVE